jgi:hypothetical protein
MIFDTIAAFEHVWRRHIEKYVHGSVGMLKILFERGSLHTMIAGERYSDSNNFAMFLAQN